MCTRARVRVSRMEGCRRATARLLDRRDRKPRVLRDDFGRDLRRTVRAACVPARLRACVSARACVCVFVSVYVSRCSRVCACLCLSGRGRARPRVRICRWLQLHGVRARILQRARRAHACPRALRAMGSSRNGCTAAQGRGAWQHATGTRQRAANARGVRVVLRACRGRATEACASPSPTSARRTQSCPT
jgi:hypothetical protein